MKKVFYLITILLFLGGCASPPVPPVPEPEAMFSQLAHELESYKIEAAIQHFIPKNRQNYEDSFRNMDRSLLNNCAESYRKTKLKFKAKDYYDDNLRIYSMPFKTPTGETVELEIYLQRTPSGWLIVN